MATQSPPVDDIVAPPVLAAANNTQLVVGSVQPDRTPADATIAEATPAAGAASSGTPVKAIPDDPVVVDLPARSQLQPPDRSPTDATIAEATPDAGSASSSTPEHANSDDPVAVDSLPPSQQQQLQRDLAAERHINGRLLNRLSDQTVLFSEQERELQRRSKAGDELRDELSALRIDLEEAQSQAKRFRKETLNAKRKLANALKAHAATPPNGSSGGGGGRSADGGNHQINSNAALAAALKLSNDELRKLRGQRGYAYKQRNEARDDSQYWSKEAGSWQMRCEREATERKAAERLVAAMQVYRTAADAELADALHQRRQLQQEVELLKNGAASNGDRGEADQAVVAEAIEVAAADADAELAEALHQRRLLQQEVELLKNGAASYSDRDEAHQAVVAEAIDVAAAAVCQ